MWRGPRVPAGACRITVIDGAGVVDPGVTALDSQFGTLLMKSWRAYFPGVGYVRRGRSQEPEAQSQKPEVYCPNRVISIEED
jgi:hypothetical protein